MLRQDIKPYKKKKKDLLKDSLELVSLPTGNDVNHANDVAYNKVFSHILVIKLANNTGLENLVVDQLNKNCIRSLR